MATTLTELEHPGIATTHTIAQALLREFEVQAPITRKFLQRLPHDKLTWKPHAKSMSAGQLAYHLALVPGSVVSFVKINPAEAPDFQFPQPSTPQEVLQAFDQSIDTVRSLLPTFDDAAMHETWRLRMGSTEVLALPRGLFLRDALLSHWYHHRGQFGVYLRLLEIPIPASFGPSADEPPPFMQRG